MSADLFAEFNELANSPAPSQQQPSSFAAPSSNGPASKPAGDPFDFFNRASAHPLTSQPTPQWPSQPSQSAGAMRSWDPAPSQPQSSTVADDDDGWGDFEVAEPSPAPPTKSETPQHIAWPTRVPAPTPVPTHVQEPEPRTRIVRASTMDLMTNNLVDTGQSSERWAEASRAPPRPKPKLRTTPSDPNVLFDADDFELQDGDVDEEDEDEFGDFETVAPPPRPIPAPAKPSKPAPSLDLLSLDDTPQPTSQPQIQKQPPSQLLGALSFGAATPEYPQAPKSPSYQDRNPFPELAIKTPTGAEPSRANALKSASPVTAWPTADNKRGAKKRTDEDDEWAAWDEFDGKPAKAGVDATEPPESWDWDTSDNTKPAAPALDDDTPPPVNVPPPSVILSAFPDLLSSGNSLFKPISGQTASIKQRVLEDPKAVNFLRGYILIAATAARVIAGRKHRWHRDKLLAKSMSISAAGSKGMKLAGLDKTQSTREDREAADVVAVWREHVGRLRSAVAAANAAGKANLKVPELGDNPTVQTAKMVPTAPKACVICGLKRDERIAKVDHDVEDSFGEWWVDHWGHRACKSFWIEHEQKLRQR